MSEPLCIDLFCGLGGWAEGFLAEGYRVIGFDIERHDYGTGGYPGQLVLQDVRTLHGSQFREAAAIVASPPCQEYSYMAMPWSVAKEKARKYEAGELNVEDLTALFRACFRIQREASEAAGQRIPLIVENVRGAQKWVGQAKANYGSYFFWGDIGMANGNIVTPGALYGQFLRPPTRALKQPGRNFHFLEKFGIPSPSFHGHEREAAVVVAAELVADHGGFKSQGLNWSDRTLRGQDFTRKAAEHIKQSMGGSWYGDYEAHKNRALEHVKQGGDWFGRECQSSMSRMYSSKSKQRKAASALIAKIPFPLAQHIARTFKSERRNDER